METHSGEKSFVCRIWGKIWPEIRLHEIPEDTLGRSFLCVKSVGEALPTSQHVQQACGQEDTLTWGRSLYTHAVWAEV